MRRLKYFYSRNSLLTFIKYFDNLNKDLAALNMLLRCIV